MTLFPIAALLFSGLQAYALQSRATKLELIAKPAVMIILLAWLFSAAEMKGAPLWFGLGIIFSLAGDIFLIFDLPKTFIAGLAAFLLAHIAYVTGFNSPQPEPSAWGFILAVTAALAGGRVIKPILASLQKRGENHLRIPVIAYSFIISIMLISAMTKIMDLSWNANAAALVSLGAFLFYLSDLILAWNKFVTPIQNGRIYNIAAYHLGQILLIAGVITQYTK